MLIEYLQEQRDSLQRTVSELTLQKELQGRELREREEQQYAIEMELTTTREREFRLERYEWNPQWII